MSKGGVSLLLHIGSDVSVIMSNVIVVLNLEQRSQDTDELIASLQKEGNVVEACPPPHKSCVVVKEKKGTVIYMSGISAATLGLRAASGGLGEE